LPNIRKIVKKWNRPYITGLLWKIVTGSQTRSCGEAHVNEAEATETQLNIEGYNKESETAYCNEATAATMSGKFFDAATKVLTLLSEKHSIV
ncbi:hypothetical protein MAR_022438, partial [Mya arenaria]